MLKLVRCAVLSVVSAFLLSIPALAQQAPPSGDTYVNSATPNVNYGSSVVLPVGPGATSYLRFNLSAVPARSTVSKATLRLYVDVVLSGGQFDVYTLPSSPVWTESALKFSSPPPPLSGSATGGHPITVTSASLNTFLLIDITSTVQGWLADPTSNNGLALSEVGGSGWFSFDSKESFLTAHQPELEIVTGGPLGAQGPQGPQGLQGPAGPAGPQGTKGDPGAIGPQGISGPVGPQGIQGPASSGGFSGIQEFTQTGTFTVPSGITHVSVELWGGGGGAGPNGAMGFGVIAVDCTPGVIGTGICYANGPNCDAQPGGGGGSGGYSRAILSVVPGNTYSVIVGAGGVSLAAGGVSQFVDSSNVVLMDAGGGQPGTAATNAVSSNTGACTWGHPGNPGTGGAAGSGAGTISRAGSPGGSQLALPPEGTISLPGGGATGGSSSIRLAGGAGYALLTW